MSAVMEAPVRERSTPTLVEARMKSAEYFRNDWVVNAEEGTTLEDIQRNEYWAHVAPQMAQFDHVDVRLETGDWVAQLLVVDVGRNWVKVHLMHHFDLTRTAKLATPADRYRIEWKGPQHKHSVIRNSDNEKVQDGFARKEEAQAWLRNHEQNIDLT